MKLLDIYKQQQMRKRPTTMGVLSAQDERYSILEEEAGLASELVDLIAAFYEAYSSLAGTRSEKLDTIEW